MSRISSRVIGAAVAAFALGGVTLQMASGHDLGPGVPSDASLRTTTTIAANDVNRAAKGDRETVAGLTVSQVDASRPAVVFRHPVLPSTTIAAQVRNDVSDATAATRKGLSKKPVKKIATACERNVSALAEVAKLLDAGRCIT